jgi:hypothetical protein
MFDFFFGPECTVQPLEASVDVCMMFVMHACDGVLFEEKGFATMSSMLRNKQPAQHLALYVQCSCEYHRMPVPTPVNELNASCESCPTATAPFLANESGKEKTTRKPSSNPKKTSE